MATYEEGMRSITLTAGSGVAAVTDVLNPGAGNRHKFVVFGAAGSCVLATDSDTKDEIAGVLQNKPQYTGVPCTVAIGGIVPVYSGAAVTDNTAVKIDSTGRVVAATLPADAALVVGRTLAAAAGAGELVPVSLQLGR